MKSALEKDRFKSHPPCHRASLSACDAIEHMKYLQDVLKRFMGYRIARIGLAAKHGKMEQYGRNPHHYSLWLRKQALAAAHQIFQVVA